MRNLHTVVMSDKSKHFRLLQKISMATAGNPCYHSHKLNAALQPLPHYMNTFWLLGEAVGVATGCCAKINSHNNEKQLFYSILCIRVLLLNSRSRIHTELLGRIIATCQKFCSARPEYLFSENEDFPKFAFVAEVDSRKLHIPMELEIQYMTQHICWSLLYTIF